jgi:RNA polymerase sigma-70 factor (ECF subfamily)
VARFPAAPREGADLASAPDAQVVTQALAGREDAAQEIVRRYERPVFNLIARMVQEAAVAEDLTQEAFAKVFRSLRTFDTELRFSAWILKIAHNTAIDHLRLFRPQLVPLDEARDEAPSIAERLPDESAPSPERAAVSGALSAALDAAIDGLRPEYRRVVVLRYQEGLDYAEIAEVLSIPIGTVKTFLHRARRALADELRAAGWGPGVTAETRSRGTS